MSIIETTKLSPARIWQAWVQVHAMRGEGTLRAGAKGYMEGSGKKLPYHVIDVIEGKCFAISWKGLGVRFVFHHLVIPAKEGAEVRYDCTIQGPFGWMVRWFLQERIRKNLRSVLKAFLHKLETESRGNSHNR